MRIDDEHRFSLSFRGLSIMTAEIRDAFSDILSVMFAQNMWAHISHPLLWFASTWFINRTYLITTKKYLM